MIKIFLGFIIGYVHINDIFHSIELSAKEYVEKSKNETIHSIINTRKIRYADVCKVLKNKDLKKKK